MTDSLAGGSPKGLPSTSTSGLASLVGRHVFDGTFPLPTLVIREDALAQNIATMARFCVDNQLELAPHAKTTMSPQIVERQMAAGAWGMTAATAWQAAQIAKMDVDRIIVANEVVDLGSLSLVQDLLVQRPALNLFVFVDSEIGVSLVNEHVARFPGRLGLLVDVGLPGGRTGVRTLDQARHVAEVAARGGHPIVGIGAFEGIIGGPTSEEALAAVDEFLARVAETATTLWSSGLISRDQDPIVTVGGSSYPDRVAAVASTKLADIRANIIVRSGCYVTHDCGAYDESSPFGARPRLPYTLTNALEVWAPVLSRPEKGLAIVGMGKRDVSFDAGMPVVLEVRRRDLPRERPVDTPAGSLPVVTALNDQHAYLSVAPENPLAVGDIVGFGISHPCTTFDKWRAIPLVTSDGIITDVVTTAF